MKPGIMLESKNPQISFMHYFLRSLVGSDCKNEKAEIVLKVFAEIQIIGMLYSFSSEAFKSADTDSLGLFCEKMAKYVSFKHLFSFQAKSALNNCLLVIFITYSLLMIFTAGFIIHNYYSRKRTKPALLTVWKSLGALHYTTAFLFIYQFCLTMINSTFYTPFSIWLTDVSLPFLIFGLIVAAVAIIFAGLFCKFLYEPLKTNYLIAVRNSNMDLLALLFKVVDPPLDIFLTGMDFRKWLRVSIMILIFAVRVRIFITRVPYYYHKPMSLFLAFSCVQLALSVVNLVMLILGATVNTQSYAMVYIGTVIAAFFPQISNIALKKKVRHYSSKDYDSIKNVNDFHWRLFALDAVISQGATISNVQKKSRNQDYEFMLYGIIAAHKKRCRKGGCGCRFIGKHNDSNQTNHMYFKEKEIFQSLKFQLLRELYSEGAKKFPFDAEIKIGLANLIFENKYRSYAPSISLVHTLNLAEQSIPKRVIAVMLLEKVEHKLISDYTNSINIKEIVDFQSASQKLRVMIESNIDKFLAFWEAYKSPDPPIMKLYACSESLNKEADQISAMWERITRDYKKLSYPDHLLYGLYQSLVRSAPYSAEKILRTYFSYANAYDPEKIREFLVTPDNVHESNNILVCIAMKREKLGVVTFITPNVEEILQYKQSDVIDKDVNLMMPDFFRERHRRILVAHVENSRTSIFNRNRQVFTQKKDGYIIPFTIYVTMFPYFQGQLSYFGLLRPVSTFDDFILVLNDGTIDSFTENIGKSLGLNPHNPKKYNLLDISKELARLHKALLPFGTGSHLKFKGYYEKKHSKEMAYLESSYSFNHQNTMSKDGQIDLQNLKETDEDQLDDQTDNIKKTNRYNSVDLAKTYDLFTSTGLSISFYKLGGSRGSSGMLKQEYNTMISEENLLGTHLRIFRLQTTAAGDEVIQNSVERNGFAESQFFDDKKTHIVANSGQSTSRTPLPAEVGISVLGEEEVFFKNPFERGSDPEMTGSNNAGGNGLSRNTSDQQNEQTTQTKDLEKGVVESNSVMMRRSSVIKKGMSTARVKEAVEEESEENEMEEKGQKIEKVQLKNFLRDNQIIMGDDAQDKNSVTSQAKADKINAKLERAIYFNETQFAISILTYIIIVFCTLSVAMVIYLHIATEGKLSLVEKDIEIFELCVERSTRIIEINRKVRMIDLFQKGLIPIVRHTNDDALLNQEALHDLAVNLSVDNNQLRNSVYKLDIDEEPQFYDLNNVYSKENPAKIRKVNGFELTTELSTAALEIYDLLSDKPDSNDLNLRFILNNGLQDIIAKSESVTDVLNQHSNDSIDEIQTTILSIILIRISLGAMIFLYVTRIQVSFTKMRARLLEAFLTIKDFEVEQSISIVNNFFASLKENRKENYFLEKAASSKAILLTKIATQKKQQNKAFKAKKPDSHGMNIPIVVNLFFTVICLSVLVILLCILLRIYAVSRDSLDFYRFNLIEAKNNLFRFELTFTSLYEYITEDGTTTVTDIPIGERLDLNYDYLSASNNYLAGFVRDGDGADYTIRVQNILQGDLCIGLFKDQPCSKYSSGVVSKGLLAMNAFMLKAIREVKDFYDSSARDNNAKTAALTMKSLVDAEDLYDRFMKTTYAELNVILLEQFTASTEVFSNTNLIFITFAVITCLNLTKFLFMLVRTRMEDQRRGYRNFMRLIPVPIIMNNRFLKNYLMATSKKILESVKNKI